LFRSTNFRREDTELVIIVTPRLVKPVRAAALKAPTDRAKPPAEADLFLLGRTDTAVGPAPEFGVNRDTRQPLATEPKHAPGGSAQKRPIGPTGMERDYGHVL
jgi:pilus assembly protein CpaC